MTYLINELKVIPGVLGACLFHSDEGVKVANLPAVFKTERLQMIGNHLNKMYAAGMTSFDVIDGLCLHFDESIIVARSFAADTLCFVVCDPAYNLNIVVMSLGLMQEEIDRLAVVGG
ncbi:MAG: hypothetical protein R6V33_07320 [Pelovirga sp.]